MAILVGLLEFQVVSHEIGRFGIGCAGLPGRKVEHQIVVLGGRRRRLLAELRSWDRFARTDVVLLLMTIQLIAFGLLHTNFALRLGADWGRVAFVRCILLKIVTHVLEVLLGAVACFCARNVEIGPCRGQARSLSLAAGHLQDSLHDSRLVRLHQVFDVGAVNAVREQILRIRGAAVRRGADRLDGQTHVRVDLLIRHFRGAIRL